MLILEMSHDSIINESYYDEIIEEIESKIDSNLKQQLRSPAIRRRMKEKCGEKAFLIPDQMKFPIMNPNSCNIDCKLLYAAYVRARQWSGSKPGYREIANKAKALMSEHSCQNKIKVTLESVGEFELDDFFEIIE